mgnify:FL=1|tara:strand:- start:4005 stop:4811 length:807 start_codon:yes stop_codon:yes gene_type:complete
MYLPADTLASIATVFVIVVYAAYRMWHSKLEAEERIEDLEHKHDHDELHQQEVRDSAMSWLTSADKWLKWETDYDECELNYELEETDRWMHADDVREKAKQNADNAAVIRDTLLEFTETIENDYVIDPVQVAYILQHAKRLLSLSKHIADKHVDQAVAKIENFLDDPCLAMRPASQTFVTEVGQKLFDDWLNLNRETKRALELAKVDYTEKYRIEVAFSRLVERYSEEHGRLLASKVSDYIGLCKNRDLDAIQARLIEERKQENLLSE